jgi:hypothetical protein
MWCHMSGSIRVLSVIDTLNTKKGSLRCAEVKSLLEDLGFEVRDGKRGGHKIFVHDGIPEFTSGAFNCGHGRNPEIKGAYITKIIRVIRELETSIASLLDEE